MLAPFPLGVQITAFPFLKTLDNPTPVIPQAKTAAMQARTFKAVTMLFYKQYKMLKPQNEAKKPEKVKSQEKLLNSVLYATKRVIIYAEHLRVIL